MEGSQRGEPIMRDLGAPPMAAGRHQGSLAARRPNYRNTNDRACVRDAGMCGYMIRVA